jgi:hypothetical protein
LKADVAGTVEGGLEKGSQVLRKSIVQTTFKELYELEKESLLIKPLNELKNPPKINDLNDLLDRMETLTADGWLIDSNKLKRGQLLEIEVLLEAEDIFRVSEVVSAVLEIVEEDSKLFGFDPQDKIIQAKAIDRILTKLLAGLVPVRGNAKDYAILNIFEKELIIHHRFLKSLPVPELLNVRPLFVVGVAEKSLFWKDIRRVLFSKASYRVLCRVAQDGVQDSWTPVKLSHVLESVFPEFGSKINIAGSGMLASISQANKSDKNISINLMMYKALVNYAKLLAEHYGHNISEQKLNSFGLPNNQQCTSFDSTKERRNAFDVIANFVLEHYELDRDPNVVAEYRQKALLNAGFTSLGQPQEQVSFSLSQSNTTQDCFVDSEFVAIYW